MLPGELAVYRSAAQALVDEREIQQLATYSGKDVSLCSLEITRTLLKLGPQGRYE